MNISATFIRKPIATGLLMAAILLLGMISYELLPVAALPNIDTPTVMVTAQLPFCDHRVTSSTTIPFGGRTNRTLSLPFTYCSPCSPSISVTAPGSGCRSSVCSNDSALPGLSAAAPGADGELSAITELKICRRCSSFSGSGQAVVGTRSSTSFRCENFAGIVCVMAPMGPVIQVPVSATQVANRADLDSTGIHTPLAQRPIPRRTTAAGSGGRATDLFHFLVCIREMD
jgi:hypothetical protein